jgi:tetratricopeptide (TPR) repeat protein
MTRIGPVFPVIIIGISILLISCGSDNKIPPSMSREGNIEELLAIAGESSSDPAMRYAALEPVIAQARNAGEADWLSALLGFVLQANPGDPYGAYYLMAMAEGARDSGSEELALDYLRRLLKNYPDLEIKDQSLHLLAMGEIANKTGNPREAVNMRLEMQRHYSDRIDPGRNLYNLAGEYRKIGDWDSMYQAYESYLNYPDTVISGVPDARGNVMSDIAFHNSSKSWTMESLDDLVGTVKYAIRTQDAGLLTRFQAENFFLMNWTQETSDSFTHIPMTLGSFLKSSIRYREDLETFSNDREAYLWTAGWSWKIPTWYLYFRRIEYPANPEIDGRWEWAGIYFGERL